MHHACTVHYACTAHKADRTMNVLNELRITYFVVSIAMNWWAIFVLQLERLCKNLVLQWRHLQDPPIKNFGYANAWNKTNDKTMETITGRPAAFPRVSTRHDVRTFAPSRTSAPTVAVRVSGSWLGLRRAAKYWGGQMHGQEGCGRGAQNPAFDAFYRKESLLLSTE